jgi:RNA polymerase sigma-70 factor (ECF subfamily)
MTDMAHPEPSARSLGRTLPAETVVREDFAEFYAREIRSVIGLVYVLSGSRNGAEDLAQESFLTAYRHWHRVQVYDNPGAWVRRVAANRAISVGRRRVAEAKALVRLGGERLTVPDLTIETEGLWASVRALPRRQAQVVALRYWDRLSAREIAEILDLSEASVKSHLQRARQSLAKAQRED